MTTDINDLVGDLLDEQDMSESDIAPPAQTYVDAIAVTEIDVDYTYQRELDRKRVAKMAAEFDPSLVGVIEVSQRADGTYRVIDGQHRLFTVRAGHRLGSKAHIACNVHTGLTPEQEAQLFFDIDRKRRRLTGWDRWNARRGAGEQIVMDIERLAREHGLKIDPGAKDNHLRCVAACEKLVELAGLDVLDEALRVAVAAYRGVPDSLRAEIVHGTGLVLAYYPDEIDRPRLVAAMQGIAPRQLSARAAALREVHSAQLPRLAAHVIVERYNTEPGPKVQDFLKRVASGSRTLPTKSGGGISQMKTIERPRTQVDDAAVIRAVSGDRSVTLSPRDREAAVRQLHKQGHSDGHIAMVLGTTGRTVLRIRQRLSIPTNQEQA